MMRREGVVLFAENLMHVFVSGAPPLSGFKYRHIAHEQGTYRPILPGYRPYLGRHELPNRTSTERRARIVFRRVMAAKKERVAEISRVLKQAGCELAPEPEAWDTIGRWIADSVEGSRERGADRYRPAIPDYAGRPPTQVGGESTTELRPLWRSLVLDLSFLLGEHMIARIGRAHWISHNEWSGGVSGEPLVVRDDVTLEEGDTAPIHMPMGWIEGAVLEALHIRLRVRYPDGARWALRDALRQVLDGTPQPFNPRKEFIAALEAHVDEHDELPDDAEMAELMNDYRLLELPELPSRLASMLDERNRRQRQR
jgi:hypothetical protein